MKAKNIKNNLAKGALLASVYLTTALGANNAECCFEAPVTEDYCFYSFPQPTCEPSYEPIYEPLAYCWMPSCGKAFLRGDFLYLRAYEGGLDSCSIRENFQQDTPGNMIDYFYGTQNDPHFDWRPAFRVGIGYQFASNGANPCEGWDIGAYWTKFLSKNQRWESCLQTRCWKLDFQVVDILLGYTFNTRPCFTIRPFAGVRGVEIDQTLKSCWRFDNPVARARRKDEQRFAGVGPLMGIEANVELGCGFRLYADAATSILYGNQRIKTHNLESTPDSIKEQCVRQNLNAYTNAIDAGFGLAWEECLGDSIQLLLKLGVEHHRYFDYNRLNSVKGDLCLDGGTFSASIAY